MQETFIWDRANAYWLLSAAEDVSLHVRPVNLYLYETLLNMRRMGMQRMILGGMHKENDGVFRFKSNFSPLRSQFFVYKHVHAPKQYAMLNHAWSKHHSAQVVRPDFFPAYRSGLAPLKSDPH